MQPDVKPTLLVLAAGMGSRYGGLKQIDPVGPGGETIMDYSVYDALRAGFGKAGFCHPRGHRGGRSEKCVGARFEKRVAGANTSFRNWSRLPPGFAVPPGRAKPWGTAHAILVGEGVIRGAVRGHQCRRFLRRAIVSAAGGTLQSGSPDYAMVGFVLRNTLSELRQRGARRVPAWAATAICKASSKPRA